MNDSPIQQCKRRKKIVPKSFVPFEIFCGYCPGLEMLRPSQRRQVLTFDNELRGEGVDRQPAAVWRVLKSGN